MRAEGQGHMDRCPRLCPGGKRLMRGSYSKHFVWGLCPGGSAFQGRGWDQGAGLGWAF